MDKSVQNSGLTQADIAFQETLDLLDWQVVCNHLSTFASTPQGQRDCKKFKFPKGRVSKPGGGFYPYDFSFSGLKTAVLRKVKGFKDEFQDLPREDLAASFQEVVAEVLVERSILCSLEKGVRRKG